MSDVTAVGFESEALHESAKQLAEQLHLVVDNHVLPRLSITADKLVLLVDKFSPLFVDFSPSIWQKRRDAGKKQGLVRACKPVKGLRIVDATAGWGRDAAVLAFRPVESKVGSLVLRSAVVYSFASRTS